jgi:hypothetical protein
VTTTPAAPLAQQALTLLESLIDDMAQRAVARHSPEPVKEKLWVDVKEASRILGDGYPPERVKQLGRLGKLKMDKKEPEKPNSPYIFLRSSLYDYSARRVFEIDQGK